MTGNQTACFSVNMGDCAPVSGNCVHSPDAIGWSPHNVLFVATHWSVNLHVKRLIAPDAIIRPSYLNRSDTSSQFCIVSAKWALDLVPEEAYPATCRLCIRTTRDLFIYRVIRCGSGRIRTSNGICFIPQSASKVNNDETAVVEKKTRKRSRVSTNTNTNTNNNTNTTSTDVSNVDDGKEVSLNASQISQYDGPGFSVISYEWFSQDLLVVVTVGGIYLLNMNDDTSDELTIQYRLFSTPAYRFINNSETRFIPTCATRVLGCGNNNDNNDARLVVASPYYLRIFTVSTLHVSLTHYVEVPLLSGIPASLCCMMMKSSRTDSIMRVYVSSPMCILHGSIHLHNSDGNSETTESQKAEWTTKDIWNDTRDISDEMVVRRFIAIPLGSFMSSDMNMEKASSSSYYSYHSKTTNSRGGVGVGGNPITNNNSNSNNNDDDSYCVLAVCQRRLLGFVGKVCIELLRCAQMDGIPPPKNVPLGISGIAIHPSCSLAVVGFIFGARRYPPFQLFPVPVNSAGGFLSRILQFFKCFTAFGNSDSQQPVMIGNDVSSAHHHYNNNNNSNNKIDSVLNELWNKQASTSYFVWEDLLPESSVAGALTRYSSSSSNNNGNYINNNNSSEKQESFSSTQNGKRKRETDTTTNTSSKNHTNNGDNNDNDDDDEEYDLSMTMFTSHGNIIHILRRKYMDLRQQYGLELFLRFPEETAVWRQILLSILRRCRDNHTRTELVLANAVQITAAAVRYAGFKPTDCKRIVKEGMKDNDTNNNNNVRQLQFKAAFQFVKLYHVQCCKRRKWIYSEAFAEQLGKFIDTVGNHWNSLQQKEKQKGKKKQKEKKQEGNEIPKFACSMCGKEEVSVLNLSLISGVYSERREISKDCSDGLHISVFSGSTFTPLSFLAENEVMSRCLWCGLFDYVIGPYCCVCDGLML